MKPLFAAFALALLPPPAWAQITYQNWNISSGDWVNAANWTDTTAPGVNSVSIIANGGIAHLTNGQSTSVDSAVVHSGTLQIEGGVFNAVNTSVAHQAEGGRSALILTGGTLNTRGIQAGHSGTSVIQINGGVLRSDTAIINYVNSGREEIYVTGDANGRGVWELGATLFSTPFTPGATQIIFDGGVLRATRDEATLFDSANIPLNIGINGFFVDTNGHDITLGANIQGLATAAALVKEGAGVLSIDRGFAAGLEVVSGTVRFTNNSNLIAYYNEFVVGKGAGSQGALELNTRANIGTFRLGADAGSTGKATLADHASLGDVTVGDAGTGELVFGSGTATAGRITVGAQVGASGTLRTDGAALSADILVIGKAGTAVAELSGATTFQNLIIGDEASADGQLLITGGTLQQNSDPHHASPVEIGRQGTGSLAISNASASLINLRVGSGLSGSGKVAVGTGGTLSAYSIQVGLFNPGITASGTSVLELDGGTIEAGSILIGGNRLPSQPKTAQFLMKSGVLQSATLDVGTAESGRFEMTTGHAEIGIFHIGSHWGTGGEAILHDGRYDIGSLWIGTQGQGSLTLHDGELTALTLNIGAGGGGDGSFSLLGGRVEISNTIDIGADGQGGLSLTSGTFVARSGITISARSERTSRIDVAEDAVLQTTHLARTASQGAVGIHFDGGRVEALADEESFLRGFLPTELRIEAGGLTFDTNGHTIGTEGGLDGVGGLTLEGGGLLRVHSRNRHLGGTTIASGTFAAAHSGALGTGNVVVKQDGVLLVEQGNSIGNFVTMEEGGTFRRELAGGTSLSGAFSLHNRDGSTGAVLLDGTLSEASTLQVSFKETSLALNDYRVGDVVILSGMGSLDPQSGDFFVLQIRVEVSGRNNLFLGWLDEATGLWVNAVEGNLGGGEAHFVGERAYNAATDAVLGYYGFDLGSGTFWAVLNHNSEFAVVPEPGAWALLGVAGAGALAWRRRRWRTV